MESHSTEKESPSAQQKGTMSLKRVIIIAAGALLGVVVLLFVITLLLAANNIEQTEQMIRLLRDLMIIFLALEGILVILALAILIIQIAQLVNIIQNEVQPILENTQEAVETANVTARFVSKNVAGPMVAFSGFFAGLSSLFGNLFGLRRALQYSREDEVSHDE
ncbi:MAG: hypothetical protein IAE89_17015 [Anaerolineae bacterium]|nr:hypothetical protein [Anaerolineae bacterium]